MKAWSQEELRKIAEADDLRVAPFREDGKTYGTPTWIWSVAVDRNLYARAYNGQSSRWYQAALRQKAGRIVAAGLTKEVAFEPIEGAINDRIDGAYRAKYRGSPYLESMIGILRRATEPSQCDAGPTKARSHKSSLLSVALLGLTLCMFKTAGALGRWRCARVLLAAKVRNLLSL